MVRAPCFHCRDAGSVPGQEGKIPHAAQGGTKKKKKKMRATETQKFSDFSSVTRNIGARPGGSGPCSLPGAQAALHQPCPPLDNSVARLPPAPDIAILHPLPKPTLETMELYDPGLPDYPSLSVFIFLKKGDRRRHFLGSLENK